MARRVVWTETAATDLEQAADYIAGDSPRYAAAFVREVRDVARSLSDLAERGRIVPEFANQQIRELFVQRYRLIYHVEPDAISIIGFIHGARDLLTLWEREERASPEEPG
jgi:plasmid stabilization system protein ParE